MSKTKKQPANADIIKPTIVFDGDKDHALQELFKEGNAPILKSVGLVKIDTLPGLGKFVAYVITTQGDKVLNIEVEQPNLREIAEETSKISFVTTFMGQDW